MKMSNHNEEENETIPYVAKIVMLYTSTNLLALALYWLSVFPPLALELFGDSNFIVGLLACVYGCTQLLAAFISGHFTDENPTYRPKVLFIGACVGLAGISSLAIAVSFDWVKNSDLTRTWEDRRRSTLPMWIVGSAILGLYQGFAATNVEAMIATVVLKGKRDQIYARKAMFEVLSGIAGCVVTLVLFLSSGNKWSVRAMSIVTLMGLGVHLCVLLVLVHLSTVSGEWMWQNRELIEKEQKEKEEERLKLERLKKEDEEEAKKNEPRSKKLSFRCTCNNNNNKDSIFTGFLQVRQDILPYFVCTADFIVTLGSGMTVRFLMLFLIKDYDCSPVVVIVITFGMILLQAIFVQLQAWLTTQKNNDDERQNNNNERDEENATSIIEETPIPVSSSTPSTAFFTRIQGIQLARFFGPICVLWLGLPQIYENPVLGALGPTLVAYILRQPTMNSCIALSRSLIMDCVKPHQRAKWNAVESLTGASWSGSALVGGIMSDKLGYRSTFLVTVGFHTLAFIVVTLASRTKEVRGSANADEDKNESRNEKNEHDEDENNATSRYFYYGSRVGDVDGDGGRPSNINVDDDDDEDENSNKRNERVPLLR